MSLVLLDCLKLRYTCEKAGIDNAGSFSAKFRVAHQLAAVIWMNETLHIESEWLLNTHVVLKKPLSAFLADETRQQAQLRENHSLLKELVSSARANKPFGT